MANFSNTTNPTPFGFFDSDTDFKNESDNVVTFVPIDQLNMDYQAILEWAKIDGNSIEDAD